MKIFSGTVNLQTISLGFNRIESINGSFLGTKNVKNIFLSNNILNSIDNKTFWNFPNLEYLSLSNNKFIYAERNSLDNLLKLNSLELNNISVDPTQLINLKNSQFLATLD